MASRKEFKRELNQTLSEIIEDCYALQYKADAKISKATEKIIDGAIETFDKIVAKMNQKDVDDMKAHFRNLRAELDKSVDSMKKEIEKIK